MLREPFGFFLLTQAAEKLFHNMFGSFALPDPACPAMQLMHRGAQYNDDADRIQCADLILMSAGIWLHSKYMEVLWKMS